MIIKYNNKYNYVNKHPHFFNKNSKYSICVCCNLPGIIGDNIDSFIHYIPNINIWENIYFCLNCKSNLLINISHKYDLLKLDYIHIFSKNFENLINEIIKYNEFNLLSNIFSDINIVYIILNYLPETDIINRKNININPYKYFI
mgnify:FL=1|tara:strand:- start:685 stop:1116 length:432 start_codon:yes stop_codon:yes gene_type:complete